MTVESQFMGRRVGLGGLMAARIVRSTAIIGVDLIPSRRVLARELGTTREDLGEIFASLR